MTTRYVGKGGSDAADGLSWANRKLTLNGADDTPVAAGDIVYVGPGVYREELVADVDGTSGNQIEYIGDVTGDNTDGVGGEVLITGSDNDTSHTRSYCINNSNDDYRTYRGFSFEGTTNYPVYLNNSDNCIVEDCVIEGGQADGIYVGNVSVNTTIRRCIFTGMKNSLEYGIRVSHSVTHDDSNLLIENCTFVGINRGMKTERVGGITVKNCTFGSATEGVRVTTSPATGQTITVNNCIFNSCGTALRSTGTAFLIEDYNNFYNCSTDRNTVNTGSNSTAVMTSLAKPLLFNGRMYAAPPFLGCTLSPRSSLGRIAGTTEATVDLYGITRPTTSSKKSWGAIQYNDVERDTGTTQGSSDASIMLADAGSTTIIVPTTNVETTISVYCYRETNYAGTLPTMVIKQPGQSDRTTTDTGSASTFNQISDTFTPAANPPYVIVEMQSLNTATSGSYAVFFDTLEVS